MLVVRLPVFALDIDLPQKIYGMAYQSFSLLCMQLNLSEKLSLLFWKLPKFSQPLLQRKTKLIDTYMAQGCSINETWLIYGLE